MKFATTVKYVGKPFTNSYGIFYPLELSAGDSVFHYLSRFNARIGDLCQTELKQFQDKATKKYTLYLKVTEITREGEGLVYSCNSNKA